MHVSLQHHACVFATSYTCHINIMHVSFQHYTCVVVVFGHGNAVPSLHTALTKPCCATGFAALLSQQKGCPGCPGDVSEYVHTLHGGVCPCVLCCTHNWKHREAFACDSACLTTSWSGSLMFTCAFGGNCGADGQLCFDGSHSCGNTCIYIYIFMNVYR